MIGESEGMVLPGALTRVAREFKFGCAHFGDDFS